MQGCFEVRLPDPATVPAPVHVVSGDRLMQLEVSRVLKIAQLVDERELVRATGAVEEG